MKTVDAQPFPYELPEQGVALIVIDMQRDFIEPGGFGSMLGNDVRPLAAIVPAVHKLIAAFRRRAWPIIHTREGHQSDLSDCPRAKRYRGFPKLRIGDVGPMGRILIDGQPGNEIVAELAPAPGEYQIVKPGKGAFYKTDLSAILADLKTTHLVFAGVTTEVCVQTSMREANDRGYYCLLIEDCTASYFPAFRQSALDMIRAQGAIVGWTATLKSFLQSVEDNRAYA